MRYLQESQAKFKARGYVLEPYSKSDSDGLYDIYHEMIMAGTNYPHEEGTREEFHACFFASGSHVYVCKSVNDVIGAFYVKANFPGRAKHIANGGYMLRDIARGNGLGTLLVEASLSLAKELGFKAMQFNLVLSQNHAAVNLYKKLGFDIIGTIPQAIRNSDGSYQDGYIFYYSFTNKNLKR